MRSSPSARAAPSLLASSSRGAAWGSEPKATGPSLSAGSDNSRWPISARVCSDRASIPALPAELAEWSTVPTTRCNPDRRWSAESTGPQTRVAPVGAEIRGAALTPSWAPRSAITRGTSLEASNAPEQSMQGTSARNATRINSREAAAGVQSTTASSPVNSTSPESTGKGSPANSTVAPRERPPAKTRISPSPRFASSRTSRRSCPRVPVTPTIPKRGPPLTVSPGRPEHGRPWPGIPPRRGIHPRGSGLPCDAPRPAHRTPPTAPPPRLPGRQARSRAASRR